MKSPRRDYKDATTTNKILHGQAHYNAWDLQTLCAGHIEHITVARDLINVLHEHLDPENAHFYPAGVLKNTKGNDARKRGMKLLRCQQQLIWSRR